MAENSLKKRKFSHKFTQNKNRKHVLQPGQKGFLATCNFRERDCIRECYNLLNEYADKIYGVEMDLPEIPKEQEDITEQLEKEIAILNAKSKDSVRRFQNVETGAANCLFIQTTLKDPVELGVKIMQDLSENYTQKSKFILRLVPILTVCRADIKSITESAGKLFDDFFLKGGVTYCIQFNKRYNNVVDRMEVIQNLAKLISDKNPTNKVDLKNAESCVIVEVMKGLCLLSIVPDYLKLKKFNIAELLKQSEKLNQNEEVKNRSTINEEIESKKD